MYAVKWYSLTLYDQVLFQFQVSDVSDVASLSSEECLSVFAECGLTCLLTVCLCFLRIRLLDYFLP